MPFASPRRPSHWKISRHCLLTRMECPPSRLPRSFLEMVAGRNAQILVIHGVVDHLDFAEQPAFEIGRDVSRSRVINKESAQPVVSKADDHSRPEGMMYHSMVHHARAALKVARLGAMKSPPDPAATPRPVRTNAGTSALFPWRLEQFDRIAGRVVEQDLRAAHSGHDVVAEHRPRRTQAPDFGRQIRDLDLDAVPAAGLRPAAVRHRLRCSAGTGRAVHEKAKVAFREWRSSGRMHGEEKPSSLV